MAVRRAKDGTTVTEIDGVEIAWGVEPPNPEPSLAEVRQEVESAMKDYDRDGNGYIDRAEASVQRIGQFFDLLDQDGDGRLYRKEILDFLDRVYPLIRAARQSRVALNVTQQNAGLFGLIDLDGDGRLSLREVRRMVELPSKYDRDGDGAVSPAEVPRRFRAAFSVVDPQTLTHEKRTFTSAPVPSDRAEAGPEWFRQMDRNRDGDVSPAEFLGPAAAFRALDADGDGLISAAEAARHRHR